MEIESSISLLSSDATSRLEPGEEINGGEKERNGNASPSSGGPRLASLTGLLMSHQKPPPPKSNNSTSSDASLSTVTPLTEGDQAPLSLIRTVRFDEDVTADQPLRRTGSFGTAGGGLHRRPGPSSAAAAKTPSTISDSDLRRFVFHHPRAKRMVSGLRVRAFTRQAFVSSFTVGLALGSVVAIVLKILNDLALRMLYN